MKKTSRILAMLLAAILVMGVVPSALPVAIAAYAPESGVLPLKDIYKDYFKIGCVTTAANLAGTNDNGEFALYHFNTVTSENNMKPESTRNNTTGAFTLNGNAFLDQIANRDLDMELIGHVLVWHDQTGNYINNALVSAANANPGTNYPGGASYNRGLEILTEHIQGVLNGYKNEDGTSKIKTWDVVNEPLVEGTFPVAYTGDWRSYLRPAGTGSGQSRWMLAMGPDFLYQAFRIARECAPDVTLILNDFNNEMPGKREAYVDMVKELNARYTAETGDTRPLIDVMGLQGHDGNWRTRPENIDAFLNLIKEELPGVRVHVTEQDLYWNPGQGNAQWGPWTDYWEREQAIQYAEIFAVYKQHADIIDRVTFWGLHDGASWRSSRHALWANSNRTIKESYWAIADPEGYLEKNGRPIPTLTVDKGNVAVGETFEMTAGFTRSALSKNATINVYFDDSKFEFMGFTPADGNAVSGELTAVTAAMTTFSANGTTFDANERNHINAPYPGYLTNNGRSVTVTCDNDYNMPGLGTFQFKAMSDIEDLSAEKVHIQVSYIKKYPDIATEFRISHPLTAKLDVLVPTAPKWRLVDPADVQLGKSYVIASEYGALANAQTMISTPGDVTGDTQIGMVSKPVTIANGKITSEVTADMIWQFGQGGNNAAASGGLGEDAGYYVLNDAPGAGGGTAPLRRESSYNAQHAPINTTNPAINGNQQSMLLHVLDEATNAVSLYIWGGNNQWNFAVTGKEDGFTAKSLVAGTTSAAQLLEQMQESPLWLYELDEDVGVQHYVMASSGANGSISPSSLAGHVWVNDGEDVTFTFNPAFGFEVDKVTVNGEEVAVTGNTYTIQNVTASGTTIHVTFRPGDVDEIPFTVYNDIFSVGNVTTAVIVDLGEGNAANLTDVSADMFTAATRNTRLNGTTVIFEGSRKITRAYVNTEPAPLGYLSPAPGSDDLVTDTPASGRYIIIEFEFWDANGPVAGAMPSGGLQGTTTAIINYRINANRELKLTDGNTITPSFIQKAVVNPALDKFVPDKTNPGGTGNMDILISIDESYKDLGPLPLFIYNHGGGRGGSSGDFFAPVQTASGATVLSKLQLTNPGKYNAHIIATQNHADNQVNNEALIVYVKKLADEGKVDLNRIYMSGFSAGSGYTVSFYTRNPEFLAAIVPLGNNGTGYPTVEQLIANPELAKTAIWPHVHKNDPHMDITNWTNYFSTGAGASGLYKEINLTLLETNQAFNFPYFGFDWTPHETEAQAYSNLIGQSNAFLKIGPSHEKYADKNIFDWMFDQSREPADVTFDLQTINWIMRERVTAVTMDMGTEIDASSLDLDTFRVHVRNTDPRNGNTVASATAFRNISKVYVNDTPELTDNPPEKGRYIVIELVWWPIAQATGASTAGDSYTYKQFYTVYQDKDFQADGGKVFEPGSVNYIQGDTINELLAKFEYGTTGPDGTGTPFRLFRPENVDLGEPQPLVLLLHGNGQGAVDDETVIRWQNNAYFAWPEIQEEYPSYVLIPSARPNEWQQHNHIPNLKNYIQGLIDDGLVDPNRVYITGSSMGGRGTWAFIQQYPDFFAAAVPISAQNEQRSVANAQALADLPIWYFVTRGDSASIVNGAIDFDTNYSQYLNNYAFTIFENNYFGTWNGIEVNHTFEPHATWLRAYDDVFDIPGREGRLVDWMFAQSKAPKADVAVTSTLKTIVAGYAANLPADVVFSGEPASFALGLYDPSGTLLSTIEVSENGRYMFKIAATEAVAGLYTIKAVGAASGVTINCVAQTEDLWVPAITVDGSSVTVTFASEVTFNTAKMGVKIGNTTIANSNVSVSEKVVTITDVTVEQGQPLVISGVKYADLFPSYSFTFTILVP